MKVSYNWLQSYIDLPYTPEELAHELTMAGLEVEKMEFLGEGIQYITVGEVAEVDSHPEDEGLYVCQVDFAGEERQIVCGADNVREGIKVPVALPGITLPDGNKVEEQRIKEVRSQGMICSEDELQLTEEKQDEIMELPDEYKIGETFISQSGRDDYVYKLDLTPNYARCLGMIGIAREIRALAEEDLYLEWPDILSADTGESSVEVEVEDEDLCSRYTARIIKDIEIKPSPDWMQQRLEAAGIRPINNVVDITNYVMLEYNQPLHAFDYDKISGNKIIVRQAQAGEELTTLDDENRELTREDLVIADEEKAIGLAGVMGGAETEVSASTNNILLEAAYFDPVSIRRTAKRHTISSESSHRFERGVDITSVTEASDRACYLFQKYGNAEIEKSRADCYLQKYEFPEIELDIDRVNSLLGIEIDTDEAGNMLSGLGFDVSQQNDNIRVKVPGFRTDVEYEADLVEEIARVYGYNNIDYTRPAAEEAGGRTSRQKAEKKLCDLLKGQGLEEAYCFSLRAEEDYFLNYIKEAQKNRPQLKNPLSKAFAEMRSTLIPGLIESLSRNARNQLEKMSLFELGNVFYQSGSDSENSRPREEQMLGLASMGAKKSMDPWDLEAPDFFYLKGVISNILDDFLITGYSWETSEHPIFHPGRCADLNIKGESVGYLGEIHPEIIEEYDLPPRAAAAEFDFSALYSAAEFEGVEYEPLPRFPSMVRDLAVVVAEEISSQELQKSIKAAASDNLKQIQVFDFYQGQQIPEGKKSLAFQLTFLNREKTLEEEEVKEDMNKIMEELQNNHQAEIRGN